MTDVVVVESPAKAKTINSYLGSKFTVLASFGHVRDLPPKDGSVRPEQDFEMDWEADDRGSRQVAAIAKALKGARHPLSRHRPGSRGRGDLAGTCAPCWTRQRALKGVEVRRITFNEITRSAVRYAIAHPRDLDQPLIEAYLARRALDYLVGFTLSPVLWRKLPGSRSAGRVQSVALRLICEREAEIEAFRPREYWTVEAGFTHPGRRAVHRPADPSGRQEARAVRPAERGARRCAAKAAVEAGTFTVASVETQAGQAQPAGAVHHLHPAAGGLPQARLRRAADHAAARSSSTRASTSTATPSA